MLLTTREVAKRLGVSGGRVRRLIYEGRVRAIKIGGRNLIREEDAHFERKRNYPRLVSHHPPPIKSEEGR
ncbi:MAG: hypothetical protein DDT30_00854 [Dehalococcoidia bacterium]|nr:hypothetical protein [Bacillota bacterium]MBT9143381.1 hypothetical protein [Bacillota bacterium]